MPNFVWKTRSGNYFWTLMWSELHVPLGFKHGQTTSPHEFIFASISYFFGAITLKNVSSWGFGKKKTRLYRGGCPSEGSFKPSEHYYKAIRWKTRKQSKKRVIGRKIVLSSTIMLIPFKQCYTKTGTATNQ